MWIRNTHLVHTSNLEVTEDGNVESTCYVDPNRPEKEVEHEYCAECVNLSRQWHNIQWRHKTAKKEWDFIHFSCFFYTD